MINNISKKLIIYISIICLIYSIIVLAFLIVPFFDKDLLLKLFDKYNVYQNLPFLISKEDVTKITYELMDYLRGKTPFLNTEVTMDGVKCAFYSLTSKIHMADCRNLFMAHASLARVAICISIFGFICTFKMNEKPLQKIFKAYKNTLIFLTIILVVIIAFACIDFDSFFILFHKIFFDNDLWLFDPNTDYIINFLPETIFIDIGIKILIFIILALLFLYLFCYFLQRNLSHREAK